MLAHILQSSGFCKTGTISQDTNLKTWALLKLYLGTCDRVYAARWCPKHQTCKPCVHPVVISDCRYKSNDCWRIISIVEHLRRILIFSNGFLECRISLWGFLHEIGIQSSLMSENLNISWRIMPEEHSWVQKEVRSEILDCRLQIPNNNICVVQLITIWEARLWYYRNRHGGKFLEPPTSMLMAICTNVSQALVIAMKA